MSEWLILMGVIAFVGVLLHDRAINRLHERIDELERRRSPARRIDPKTGEVIPD